METNPKPTFTENQVPIIDYLNQCFNCRKGSETDSGRYLIKDVRGYKLCNLCIERNPSLHQPFRKLSKKEKKKFRIFKREIMMKKDIKHITLDSKGRIVE